MTEHQKLQTYREQYFQKVVEAFPFNEKCRVLVITHLLQDRPAFLSVLNKVVTITRIVPIPYSLNPKVENALSSIYHISHLTLEEMNRGEALLDLFSKDMESSSLPLAVMEIGGYFASIGNVIRQTYGSKFLGCVEDTENGHRRYEREQLHFPVVSVARSSLKQVEDKLIGPSVMFSVERFVRRTGAVLAGMQIGIFGYGKIGASVARAADARGCGVVVYDVSSHKRLLALADGFRVPAREVLLRTSDIIIGATGSQSLGKQDFQSLRDGTLLASASSKRIEFDMSSLKSFPHVESKSIKGVQQYRISPVKNIYVLANGEPVNFVDGAVVGPALALVQSELLLAVRMLERSRREVGLLNVNPEEQEVLCDIWATHFIDDSGGPTAQYEI